jgi:hypothetical protein
MGNFLEDTTFMGLMKGPDYKPSTETRMTPAGENLETALYENLKKNLFPENLASRFIGQAKRFEQGRQREWRGQFQGLSAPGTQNVVSGQAIGGGLLSEAQARLSGGSAGYRQVGEAKRGFAISRLGNLQNFMNLQSQTPMLKAEADLLKGELKQQQGYETGATIGTILRLAAMGA